MVQDRPRLPASAENFGELRARAAQSRPLYPYKVNQFVTKESNLSIVDLKVEVWQPEDVAAKVVRLLLVLSQQIIGSDAPTQAG